MDCRELLDKLYLLMDEELDEHECAHMRAHMKNCHPCHERLLVEERFKRLVAEKCSESGAPSELVEKIRHAIVTDQPL